ncbi:hypothetical protein [Psychrobacter sp.]|uniref:hypothetical protein n=1 Tax=Psychrobacter sp. TaxID=56811 RepID=UPI003BB0049F
MNFATGLALDVRIIMNPELSIKKIWFDDDLTELLISVCDGCSTFTNTVYIAKQEILSLIDCLNIFKNHYYGGLEDITWGGFGYEYANGAFAARLHFPKPSILYISTYQQGRFFEYKEQQEAAEAKMYLKSEPVLLDNFIEELKDLDSGITDVAKLVCI